MHLAQKDIILEWYFDVASVKTLEDLGEFWDF